MKYKRNYGKLEIEYDESCETLFVTHGDFCSSLACASDQGSLEESYSGELYVLSDAQWNKVRSWEVEAVNLELH